MYIEVNKEIILRQDEDRVKLSVRHNGKKYGLVASESQTERAVIALCYDVIAPLLTDREPIKERLVLEGMSYPVFKVEEA